MTQGAVDARAHQPVRTRTHFFDTLFSQCVHHHSSALHINCIAPMPRPPTQTDARPPVQTVIAMGRKTPHWKTLSATWKSVVSFQAREATRAPGQSRGQGEARGLSKSIQTSGQLKTSFLPSFLICPWPGQFFHARFFLQLL